MCETQCGHADAGPPPHPGHHSVQDERLDRRHLALWVVDGDEDVLSVGILFALIIVLQSVLVDHGAGRVGQGASIWQGSILEHRESANTASLTLYVNNTSVSAVCALLSVNEFRRDFLFTKASEVFNW